MEWKQIKTAPVNSKRLFVVAAFHVPLPSGQTYNTDPYCVWAEGGTFVRWPHKFSPTHWIPLPDFPND